MGQTSANTETIICYTCNSDINNGVVQYYETPVPHPVYSDLTGGTVVQLNMITLGGPNGLYA